MTGFPWASGDELLAADLNAAIAAASSAVAAGALPGIVVPAGGSIQAAHDALPATGGEITLLANTTYVLTATLTISKPNVTIQAPSWNTVIRRGAGVAGHLILSTAAGFTLQGVTVDGNSAANTDTNFQINVTGTDNLVQHCQVINYQGGGIALGGVGCRADGNRVTGLGSATVGGYGIWAISHVKTLITNNHITGTTIDAIGFDGQGTQVIGNYVANCQCGAASGGQICQYAGYAGALIQGNFVDQGGGANSYGIELDGINVAVIGNSIVNQKYCGIFVDASAGNGMLISGNSVLNCGQATASSVGLIIYPPINNIVIVGNRFADTQATPTQAWGIWFSPGTCNNVVIVGNDCTGNIGGNNLGMPSAGTGHVARDNLGANDLPGVPAGNYVNDAAAATGGIPVGGTYRNGSAIMVRVA